MTLDEYDLTKINQERIVLVITSTFGNGELPGNATKFLSQIQQLPAGGLSQLKLFGDGAGQHRVPAFLRSRGYPRPRTGPRWRHPPGRHAPGDEIKGQSDTFRQWLDLVARLLGEDPTSANGSTLIRCVWRVVLPAGQIPANEVSKSRLAGVEVAGYS